PHIFEDDSDRIQLIKEAIDSIPYVKDIYSKLDSKRKNQYPYDIYQFISTVKRELIDPDEFAQNSNNIEFKYLFETYQDILKSNNAIDFDDIILLVYDLFTNNESVANLYRKSYSYICIDECQDLNKLQYFLLKSLCGNIIKNIMMVGDPNQSIYGFTGASPNFMQEEFVNDFQAEKHRLEENYRCSKLVNQAANTLMNLDTETINYVKKGIFEIKELDTEEKEAEYIVKKIKELIFCKNHEDIEGEINYDKITILGRNKFVFKHVENLIKSEGIPYYYKTRGSGLKFNSTLMQIFDLFFRIKINPLDKLHQNKLIDILKTKDINNSDELKISKFPFSINIKEIVDTMSIENIHLKINDLKTLVNNIITDDNEKKLTLDEIEDLNSQLILYKKQNQNTTLEGFKTAIALGLSQNNTKEIGICFSTVHTMKGQENDIVFLIGMDEGTFPDFRAIKKNGEDLKQEKNNAYVAFTRARRFLFVTYPKKRLMPWGDYKVRDISQFLKFLLKN
ncbi:MAG: ATP-dependent helicase, partial [Candidatus Sericytochromatia bacterium]